MGCMSFGVKSLLTPNKVSPREASSRVIPPGPALVFLETLGQASVCEMVHGCPVA